MSARRFQALVTTAVKAAPASVPSLGVTCGVGRVLLPPCAHLRRLGTTRGRRRRWRPRPGAGAPARRLLPTT